MAQGGSIKVDTKFPIRQDIEVIPADLPKGKPLGFIIREFIGSPVEDLEDNYLTSVSIGQEILCYGMKTIVESSSVAKTGNLTCFLVKELRPVSKFEEKELVVCYGVANMRGLEKLEIKT